MLSSGRSVALSIILLAACGESRPAGGSPTDDVPPPSDEAASHMSSQREGRAGTVAVEITGEAGGVGIAATGRGECRHAADGSIYQRPASLWTVRFDGVRNEALHRLDLTFWREHSGSESVTLALDVGGKVHRIATVEGGERQGSARAGLEGGSDSGLVTVEGTSAEGAPVRLRVRCERFTALVAEGG